MASSILLASSPHILFYPKSTSPPSLPRRPFLLHHRRLLSSSSLVVRSSKNGGDSADLPDRILAAACYLYPFLDGVHFGRFVLTQFPAFQVIIQPLVPAIRLFRSTPFTPLLIFFTLYFAVVRNPGRFSRYVRFNTMQAIVLDVLLIFPDLLERAFDPNDGIALDLLQSFDSTVFLFLLVSLIYGSSACILGQVPRLPIVAEAAERQVM